MIIKNQALLIVSSLSVKKIQGKLWTNKAAITKVGCSMFHPKWEQSPSQFWWWKSKKNSNDEVEWKHSYWNKKHLSNWETLKPTGFENSPKCPASCPSLLHLVVSSLHRQTDLLWHFPTKKSTYWGYNGSQSSGNEEGRMNWRSWSMIYQLIYWNEMLCYSCEFVPQVISSNIILGPN